RNIEIVIQDRIHQELLPAILPEYPVIVIGHALGTITDINAVGIHPLAECIFKIDLRGEFIGTLIRQACTYLEVDMRRTAIVPTGKYGEKTDITIVIGL